MLASLSVHRDRKRKNFLLDGDRDQLRLVVNVEFAHQVEFVGFHRLDADSENRRCFFHGVALGKQLHDFAFPQRASTVLMLTPRTAAAFFTVLPSASNFMTSRSRRVRVLLRKGTRTEGLRSSASSSNFFSICGLHDRSPP